MDAYLSCEMSDARWRWTCNLWSRPDLECSEARHKPRSRTDETLNDYHHLKGAIASRRVRTSRGERAVADLRKRIAKVGPLDFPSLLVQIGIDGGRERQARTYFVRDVAVPDSIYNPCD